MDPLHPDVGPRDAAEDAVALHVLYEALKDGGFTRDEALLLVGYVIAGGREALWTVQRHLPP